MTAQEIIKLWNSTKGSHYKTGSSEGMSSIAKKISNLIEELGEEKVTLYYNEQMKDANEDIWKISDSYLIKAWEVDKENEPSQPVQPKEEVVNQSSNILGLLSNEIVGLMGKELANKIGQEVENKINGFIQDKVLMKVVEYQGARNEVKGITHKMFEPLLKFVSMDEPVMLVGPAGTGKNVLVKQVADALGLNFYFTSAVTQEYKLTGYGDANGNYVPTQFYEAFVNGGVFLFDEVDASSPDAMVVVNSAIANRYFDFPVIGRVEANPDFRIIACANTYGTGASMDYVGRNQLDGATLNRFAILEVDYDKRIEDGVCPDKDIADFCRSFRKICDKNGVHHIVSYREMSRMYKMIVQADLDKEIAVKSCLTKGLEKDTLNMIASDMNDNLVYKGILKSMINKL